jgi:hypothetical protein
MNSSPTTTPFRIHMLRLTNLAPHPLHPGRVDAALVTTLARQIQRTGLYEPLIVQRAAPRRYHILAGLQRLTALRQLGYQAAACLRWPDDPREALALLAAHATVPPTHSAARCWSLLRELYAQWGQQCADLLPTGPDLLARLNTSPIITTPGDQP